MTIILIVKFPPSAPGMPPKRVYLCRDGKLREWALWGNTYLCVKTYRSWGWAERMTRKLKEQHPSALSITASRVDPTVQG